MVREELDRVDNKPMEKKSLLERYDIPVEDLCYEYISQCNNVKKLERIVLILRSGEEGCYPDLTEHAEGRLAEVEPNSAMLRMEEPVLKKDMLAPEKRIKLENDINEWMSEMKLREKDLDEGRAMQINEPIPQPDIRKTTFSEPKKQTQSPWNQDTKKPIGACDYAGWDKYDADTESDRIDLKLEQEQAKVKKEQKKLGNKEQKIKQTSWVDKVKKLTFTGTELNVMVEKEREKGNEAFKADDYEEALHYYNSSIGIAPTINAHNNRAITYIKLQRYEEAIYDCDSVISINSTNIKGLLRRGFALDHLEKRTQVCTFLKIVDTFAKLKVFMEIQALADYEAVLKLEPSNKVAIAALNNLRRPCDSKKIRMKIVEASIKDENTLTAAMRAEYDSNEKSSRAESKTKTISKGISHIDKALIPLSNSYKSVSHNSRFSGASFIIDNRHSKWIHAVNAHVCFCNNAPSSSKYSSPRPHIKDIYCPKAPKTSRKFSKPQSTFTDDEMLRIKSSDLIIEEIPNKQCAKSKNTIYYSENNNPAKKHQDATLKNFCTGDNEGNNEESLIIVEELPVNNTKVKSDEKTMNPVTLEKFIDFSKTQINDERNSFTKCSEVIIKEISNEASVESKIWRHIERTKNKAEKRQESETNLKNLQSGDKGRIAEKSNVIEEELTPEKNNFEFAAKNDVESYDSNFKMSKKSSSIPTSRFGDEGNISFKKSPSIIDYGIMNKVSKKYENPNFDQNIAEKLRESEILNSAAVNGREPLVTTSFKIITSFEEKFGTIESPYEFTRRWLSLRNDPDLVLHAELLKALPPENIHKVLKNILSFLKNQGYTNCISDLRRIYEITV